jgi:DNA-binding MarR family transcriptional regulator
MMKVTSANEANPTPSENLTLNDKNQDLTSKPQKSLGEIGLSQFAPYLMNRIVGSWNINQQEDLRKHNLSTAKMRTLAVLSIISGLTINELSDYTVTEQSTMSRSLDSLEKQGLIKRESSDNDGRVRRIYITDDGRSAFDKFWPAMHDSYKMLFAGVTEQEHEQLIKILQKILLNTDKK